jgi:hypothetical protein
LNSGPYTNQVEISILNKEKEDVYNDLMVITNEEEKSLRNTETPLLVIQKHSMFEDTLGRN